jgi:hypothetical protein
MLELTTPPALLATPKTEGGVTPPLSNADAELVNEVIEEAKRYVKGERSQGVMDLGEDEEDDSDQSDDQTEPKQGVLIEMPAKGQGKAKGRRVSRSTDKAAAGAR